MQQNEKFFPHAKIMGRKRTFIRKVIIYQIVLQVQKAVTKLDIGGRCHLGKSMIFELNINLS